MSRHTSGTSDGRRVRTREDGPDRRTAPDDQAPGARRPDDRTEPLAVVFERVTGSTTLVERQEQTGAKRCLDDHDASVSAYVSETATADGLSDAISTPDLDESR